MIERIPLEGRIHGGASVQFLSAEVPWEADRYIPFALVRCSFSGESQPRALRFDLDKCTFAEHFEGDREAALRAAGSAIVQLVGLRMRERFIAAVKKGEIK